MIDLNDETKIDLNDEIVRFEIDNLRIQKSLIIFSKRLKEAIRDEVKNQVKSEFELYERKLKTKRNVKRKRVRKNDEHYFI